MLGLFPLGANRWAGGAIHPCGFVHLERFRLEGATPVWTYACADALLEKRIWMEHGANTTYVQYRVVRASGPLKLSVKVLVNFRGYHFLTRGAQTPLELQPLPEGLAVKAGGAAPPFYLLAPAARCISHIPGMRITSSWRSRSAGLTTLKITSMLLPCNLRCRQARRPAVASTQAPAQIDIPKALESHQARQSALLAQCTQANPESALWPEWIRQLVLAADQFIAQRSIAGVADATSIIAGYPWFGDWGRDTMIALPGLLLVTGRPETGRPHPAHLRTLDRPGNASQSSSWMRGSRRSTTPLMRLCGISSGAAILRGHQRFGADPRNLPSPRPSHYGVQSGNTLQHSCGSRGWIALRRRAGCAAHLDGFQGWRLGGDAAPGETD